MRIFLCPNLDNQRNKDAARAVAARLSSLGISCVTAPENRSLFSGMPAIEFESAENGRFDLFGAVGGDGTMLKSAQLAIAIGKPIFGINSGRIGFLSAFDLEDFLRSATLEELNAMTSTDRALLDVYFASRPEHRFFAVNEVVVSKANCAKTVEINLCYGNNNLGRMRCDGVIASTPTGATGYSLSAGGPIVEPTLDAVILTPICSHSLFSKPYVLASSRLISIQPVERVQNEVVVAADGNVLGTIDHTDWVYVAKSTKVLKLMTSARRNFYDVLYNEISERR